MKRLNKVIIVVLVIAGLLFSGWKVYYRIYFNQVNEPITIKCHYMMYACGDCYSQWRIDSNFAAKNEYQELMRNDFIVMHKGKQVEESLPDSIDKCMICYDFYFTGILKKTLSHKFKFEADTFLIKLERPDCCN